MPGISISMVWLGSMKCIRVQYGVQRYENKKTYENIYVFNISAWKAINFDTDKFYDIYKDTTWCTSI